MNNFNSPLNTEPELCVGYSGKGFEALIELLEKRHITCSAIHSPQQLSQQSLSVLLVDADMLQQFPLDAWRQYTCDCIFASCENLDAKTDLILPNNIAGAASISAIQLACQQWVLKRQQREMAEALQVEQDHIAKMAAIGISLSGEKDLSTLLQKILFEAQNLACCDAASLFLVDKSEADNAKLVFKLTSNDSIEFPFEEQSFALNDNSIAGYTATHAKVLNIDDVYQIPSESPYQFNYGFDDSCGYRCVSLLSIPMRNHREEVLGVLQFINKKSQRNIRLTTPEISIAATEPFDDDIVIILRALASQSAIALENNILLDSINRLFEGFVHASVAAIEQRDPTTSGHSFRVADLSISLAEALPHSHYSRFKRLVMSPQDIRQLRYAALLHDFGKVGVREHVLTKAKKLHDGDLSIIKHRISILRQQLSAQASEAVADLFRAGNHSHGRELGIKENLNSELVRLDTFLKGIIQANEPSVLPESGFEFLREVKCYPFVDELNHEVNTLLSDEEHRRLSIAKGSLSSAERREIESHVIHTENFLRLIPWTPELNGIPNIAAAHHEKLDGSGYPKRLRGEEIPIASRIMTVCDIYDALTASDRPYKPAVPLEFAYKILESEAKSGMLDQMLVKVFIEADIHRVIEDKKYPKAHTSHGNVYHHHVCDFDLHRGHLH